MKRSLASDSDSSCHCHRSKISHNNNIMPASHKIFNDSVHGHMKFHPLCVAIIDTPQFQRLRNLKQLSTTYYVYPGACHNRFEHCLGVSYLAGCMVDALVHNTPHLTITPEEKLSVEVAGLCHDLGHGPFSHTWERFLDRFNISWKHESASEQVLNYLIEDNNLGPLFESYNLNLNLIKELMRGEGTSLPIDKSYLYQIIANKVTDIDVDKWDYFLRDGHQLNLKITFDYRRILAFCTVVHPQAQEDAALRHPQAQEDAALRHPQAQEDAALRNPQAQEGAALRHPQAQEDAALRHPQAQEGAALRGPHIAFRNKEAPNIFDMFRVRADLHYRAYQHRAVKNTELLLIDALVTANEFYQVEADGRKYKLSEAHTNVKALCKLTDHIQYSIEYSSDPRLAPAQKLLHRLSTRQLYTLLGEFQFYGDKKQLRLLEAELNQCFAPHELVLDSRFINMGSTGTPLDKVVFYKKPTSAEVELDTSLRWDKLYRYFPFDISKDPNRKELLVFCKSEVSEDAKAKIIEYVKQYLDNIQA